MGYNARSRIWQLAISEGLGLIIIVIPYFFLLITLAWNINEDVYSSKAHYVWNEVTYFFRDYLPILAGVIAVEMGVLCALSGFCYLNSRGKAPRYSLLPKNRNQMFWAIYWNGLLIWFLPFLFNTLLLNALTFTFFHEVSLILLYSMVKTLLVSFLVFCLAYHFSLLCTMFSRHFFVTLPVIAILGAFITFCYLGLYAYAGDYVASFDTSSYVTDSILFVTPLMEVLFFSTNMQSEILTQEGLRFVPIVYTTLFLHISLCLVGAWRLYQGILRRMP